MSLDPAVESLIAEAPVSAHLATAVDDRPHVAAVWYGYRDGVVYVLTGGRKLEKLRRNPRVALSIEGEDVAWNVTLLGTATVTTDEGRMDWAEGWIYDRYGADEAAADGGTDDEAEESALVEIEVASTAWNIY